MACVHPHLTMSVVFYLLVCREFRKEAHLVEQQNEP